MSMQEFKQLSQLNVAGLELAKTKAAMAILMGDAPNREVGRALEEVFDAVKKALDTIEIEQFKLDS